MKYYIIDDYTVKVGQTLHIIIQAAEKVKENSGKRCRNLKNIGIEYTMLSNVHSTTTPGLVIVSKYKIVKV